MTLKEISLTPQNDFLFKSIFAKKENKEMLKEFLEGILKAKIDKLSTAQQEVTIGNTTKGDKECRVDVQVVINGNCITNMEMQVRDEGNMIPRSIFSAAASLHTSLEAGKNYTENKKTIVICILAYNLFPKDDYIISASIRKDNDFQKVSDKLQIYYIQLPNFIKKKNKPNDILTQWLYFIRQEDKEGVAMAVKENEKVAEAQRQLIALLKDKEVKQKILAWEKAEYSRQTALTYARDKGISEGEKSGIKQEKIIIAKKMLNKKMKIEQIIELTDLSKKQIKNLAKEIEKEANNKQIIK